MTISKLQSLTKYKYKVIKPFILQIKGANYAIKKYAKPKNRSRILKDKFDGAVSRYSLRKNYKINYYYDYEGEGFKQHEMTGALLKYKYIE